ncbi:MAG: hypothetical protein QNJ53_26795 [Pleurocapsa sp. MO_192.B19]|nr:hypothetical protein [Pleurocapsa sp. MO_192.B19]
MRKQPQPNLIDQFKLYLESSLEFAPSTVETYWDDLAVVLRSVIEQLDDDSLQKVIAQSGYSGNYKTVINHLRKAAEKT